MLDNKDKKIIDILRVSGREPASSISEKIGMSVPTVIDRIKKLHDSGVIEGYRAVVNSKKIGLDKLALVFANAKFADMFLEGKLKRLNNQ